jgi:hypothetical protein
MAMVRMCYMNRRSELTASSAEIQKKKSEPAPVKVDSIIKSGNGHHAASPPVKEEGGVEKTLPAKTEDVGSETEEQPITEINTSSLSAVDSGDLAIPSLKGLQSLREKASLKYEEEKKKTPALNLVMVQEFWKEFSDNHSSQSLRHTLNEAVVEIKGEKTIIIRTGNQTGKNRLTAETNLLDGLRSLIRIPDLQIVVEIDPELDKSKELIKPKKLLTSREKFEILSAKNPLMQELRDKLDLIPDQDE